MNKNPDQNAGQAETQTRREAIKKLGKYAAYTSPVLMSMLLPQHSRAASSGDPSGSGGSSSTSAGSGSGSGPSSSTSASSSGDGCISPPLPGPCPSGV